MKNLKCPICEGAVWIDTDEFFYSKDPARIGYWQRCQKCDWRGTEEPTRQSAEEPMTGCYVNEEGWKKLRPLLRKGRMFEFLEKLKRSEPKIHHREYWFLDTARRWWRERNKIGGKR